MTDPYMTNSERSRLVRLLQQTRDDFLATVGPVSDAQWDFRPGPDRWSIGLITEHLGLVERGLFNRVERALEGDANPDWQSVTEKNELIEQMLDDRAGRSRESGADRHRRAPGSASGLPRSAGPVPRLRRDDP